VSTPDKSCFPCTLLANTPVTAEIFRLDFEWPGAAPRPGQFFMIRPLRSSVFLPRPISAALWEPAVKPKKGRSGAENRFRTANTLRFLISKRGRGTAELADMRVGEQAELSGPLGNSWEDFAVAGEKPIALVGGGIGVAPLLGFAGDDGGFHFYAGFRTGFKAGEQINLLGPSLPFADKLVLVTEDGSEGSKGRVPDFLDPLKYRVVYACGPEPMLKSVAASCKTASVPCFISLERRMACGVGACLGCRVKTTRGNRRCCADGPIFPAEEVLFE
jgi:NAD(P)H-flavin reductase